MLADTGRTRYRLCGSVTSRLPSPSAGRDSANSCCRMQSNAPCRRVTRLACVQCLWKRRLPQPKGSFVSMVSGCAIQRVDSYICRLDSSWGFIKFSVAYSEMYLYFVVVLDPSQARPFAFSRPVILFSRSRVDCADSPLE